MEVSVSKPFLEQLENWILLENFTELDRCEFKVAEILKNFGRVETEMLADANSFLWEDPMALACLRDLKKLRSLIKRADKVYKKRSKLPLTQASPVVECEKRDVF